MCVVKMEHLPALLVGCALCCEQYNVMKDYEAWDLQKDYHYLLVGQDGGSDEGSLSSHTTRLTPGTWYIGVTNTENTVLSSMLSR